MKILFPCFAFIVGCGIVIPAANAQQSSGASDSDGLEEIIVTAREFGTDGEYTAWHRAGYFQWFRDRRSKSGNSQPEWSGSLSATFQKPISSDWDWFVRPDITPAEKRTVGFKVVVEF